MKKIVSCFVRTTTGGRREADVRTQKGIDWVVCQLYLTDVISSDNFLPSLAPVMGLAGSKSHSSQHSEGISI